MLKLFKVPIEKVEDFSRAFLGYWMATKKFLLKFAVKNMNGKEGFGKNNYVFMNVSNNESDLHINRRLSINLWSKAVAVYKSGHFLTASVNSRFFELLYVFFVF